MRRYLFAALVWLTTTLASEAATEAEWKLCQGRDADVAIAACTRILTERLTPPNEALALVARGRAHRILGQLEAAYADVDRAMTKVPRNPDFMQMRSQVLSEQGLHERALADIEAALKLRSNDARLLASRAFVHFGRGKFEEAERDARQALRIDPKSAIAHNELGRVLSRKRLYEKAVQSYSEAAQLSPQTALYLSNRAAVLSRLGEYRRALADFDQAVRLRPNSWQVLAQRGRLHATLKDYPKAAADAEQAIRLKPDYAPGYAVRGLANVGLGRFPNAIKDFNDAIRIAPTRVGLYASRGEAYEKSGDATRALADFARALELKALSPDAEVAQNNARQMRDILLVSSKPVSALAPTAPPPAAVAALTAGLPKSVAKRRIALIIGNSSYKFTSELINPKNDAADIAALFRSLRFDEVVEKHNLSLAQLEQELVAFGERAAAADWAVVYYAGHGMELEGQNFLIPIDANLTKPADLPTAALPLERLVARVEPAGKLRLVILDACRDNPFAKAVQETGQLRSLSRGLGSIEPEAGTLIAYAARGGTAALDGQGRNSPYAEALLKHLAEPGLDIRFAFDKVRTAVQQRTAKVQVPFHYGSLPAEQFVFRE